MLTDDQQIFEQIKKAEKILIAFQKNYTGDGLTSALAFFLFLKKIGKKAEIISADFQESRIFSFLPGIKEIKNNLQAQKKFIISLDISQTKAKEISYQVENNRLDFIVTPENGQFTNGDISSSPTNPNFDLIIVPASPDLESLGKIYGQNTELFFNIPLINIDHHPQNEEFGQINKIKITAVSTTEIIFELLNTYSTDIIDEEIATCLLTGIITESKSFKVGSLTPGSLNTASQLIAKGADREKIISSLYQKRNINTLKLWGRVLAKIKSDLNNKLVWSTLNKMDFDKTGAKTEDLENITEELIVNIPQAEVIALFSELEDGRAFVKIYSSKNINISYLIKEYSTPGNKNSAEFTLSSSLNETEEKIISHIKEKLVKLPV